MTFAKKSYRSLPAIERSSNTLEESAVLPQWMKNFANTLQKQSVQPFKSDQSLYDQISSVMNGTKSKYLNVEDAVRDMQERSGLSAYRNKVEAQKNNPPKVAQVAEMPAKTEVIRLFEENPTIKNTIDNYLEDTQGNLTIPGIVERIRAIHRGDVPDDSMWEDDNLLQYVNNKNIEVKRKYPNSEADSSNLGRLTRFDGDEDPSENDPLFSLTPAVVK
jgi:hypothetical protein